MARQFNTDSIIQDTKSVLTSKVQRVADLRLDLKNLTISLDQINTKLSGYNQAETEGCDPAAPSPPQAPDFLSCVKEIGLLGVLEIEIKELCTLRDQLANIINQLQQNI